MCIPFAMYNEHVGSLSPEVVDWIGRVEPSEYFYYLDYGLLLIFGGIPWQVSQRYIIKHGINQLRIHDWYGLQMPITVAERSEAWAVFARSNSGVVGTNPTRGMNVCVCLFCISVFLFVVNGLATAWSSVQKAVPTELRTKKLKKKSGESPKVGYRAIDDDDDYYYYYDNDDRWPTN
jgi:hypothetical protein